MNAPSLYVVDWFVQYELDNITQICSGKCAKSRSLATRELNTTISFGTAALGLEAV
jgi:hypothetical protein